MQFDIHWKNSHPSKAAEVHAHRRANLTLDRFESRIRTMSVHFEDINGPKGGVDKRCTVEASGSFAHRIASANADTYFAAADRAMSKLERGVSRALERQIH
jgi:ribosome-associated translation inhibitor RaiA